MRVPSNLPHFLWLRDDNGDRENIMCTVELGGNFNMVLFCLVFFLLTHMPDDSWKK